MLKKSIFTALRYALLVPFSAIALPVAAEILDIKLAYIGNTENNAWLGVQQGLVEANLQGQFLGQSYTAATYQPADLANIDFSPYLAIITAVDHELFQKITASQPGMAVFNITLEEDDLRTACMDNALHIIPSASMRSDAEAQWARKNPGTRAKAYAWHPDFVKYAGRDLNKRFLKNQGTKMDDPAWSGWAAVKMIADSVAREKISQADKLLAYMKTGLIFDGQKGEDLNFRKTGQLRQPLILVEDGEIVAEAPVKGVAKPPTLDSLGLLNCEK